MSLPTPGLLAKVWIDEYNSSQDQYSSAELYKEAAKREKYKYLTKQIMSFCRSLDKSKIVKLN
jgi:hypothetical protein